MNDSVPPFGVEHGGVAVEPRSNQIFSLHEPEQAWIVSEGALDVFLVESRRGAPVGVRHHVLRARPGVALFGLPKDPGAAFCLAAVPSPGTRLWRLEQARLRCLALSDERARSLLERWIELLASAGAHESPPRTSLRLEATPELVVGDEARALVPLDRVLWVRHVEGHSLFLADPALELPDGNAAFPVSRAGWVEAAPGARLEVVETAHLRQSDERLAALDGFHEVAFQALLLARRRAEERERQQRARRAEADGQELDAALKALARPLREGDDVAHARDAGDALLRACQAVGQAQGIEITGAADGRGAKAGSDSVAAIARASGVRVRRVVLHGSWWREDSGPLLAFLDSDNRPLALLPASSTSYRVYDPMSGGTRELTAEAAATLNGFAYVLYRPFPRRALSLLDIASFGLTGCWRDVGMVLGLGAVTGLLATVMPVFTGIVFDTVIPGAERGQLLQLSLMLAAAAVCATGIGLASSCAQLRWEGRMDATLQAAVWDRLLGLPVPFFRSYSSGDLAVRALGIAEIRSTLTGPAMGSILAGVFSLFSFGLLFHYSARLALLATVLAAVAVAASLVCSVVQLDTQRELSRLGGRLSGTVLQIIRGVPKIKMAGAEGRAFGVWAVLFGQQREASLRSRRVSDRLGVFNAAFSVLAIAALFEGFSSLAATPEATRLSTGSFLAFVAAFGQFFGATLQLGHTALAMLAIVPLYERSRAVLESLPEVDPGKTDPGELRGDIDVQHLAFRYAAGSPSVLRDVTISIKAGELVAIVGASGCGKSTLMRLLLGFEKPEAGAIYYDGHDLVGLDVQAVRRQLGVVLQNGRLMTGDIFSNIVGSAPLTIEHAREAVRQAGLEEDIEAMPMGLHTMVTENGGDFSGGQRQRLMIARAIVARPRIVLFDEATSALDNETQAVVSRSLKTLQATRIVIAHRLSTVRHADRIVVLDGGIVAESGSYAELMVQGGLFSRLAQRQLLEEPEDEGAPPAHT